MMRYPAKVVAVTMSRATRIHTIRGAHSLAMMAVLTWSRAVGQVIAHAPLFIERWLGELHVLGGWLDVAA